MENTKEKISRVSIASLVLAMLAFVLLIVAIGVLHFEVVSLYICAVLTSILAVVFATIGIRKKGRTLAIIGLIIGCISLAIELAIFLFVLIGSIIVVGTVGGYVGFIQFLKALTSVP